MNMYAYAVIPLIVIVSIGLLLTAWLTIQVLKSLGAAKLITTLVLCVVYGFLARAVVEFKIIENALATILTLSAALLSRAMALSESYKEYKFVINNPNAGTKGVKSLVSRFIEITPDIVLVGLLLVLARDIREKYEVNAGAIILIYVVEFLYAAVLCAYIGIGDKTDEILKKQK